MDNLPLAFACYLLQTFACLVSIEMGRDLEGVNPLQPTVNILGLIFFFASSTQAHVKL